MSGPLHKDCTPTSCPSYGRHVRQRFEWAYMRNLYSPSDINAELLSVALADYRNFINHPQPREEFQLEEQFA